MLAKVDAGSMASKYPKQLGSSRRKSKESRDARHRTCSCRQQAAPPRASRWPRAPLQTRTIAKIAAGYSDRPQSRATRQGASFPLSKGETLVPAARLRSPVVCGGDWRDRDGSQARNAGHSCGVLSRQELAGWKQSRGFVTSSNSSCSERMNRVRRVAGARFLCTVGRQLALGKFHCCELPRADRSEVQFEARCGFHLWNALASPWPTAPGLVHSAASELQNFSGKST